MRGKAGRMPRGRVRRVRRVRCFGLMDCFGLGVVGDFSAHLRQWQTTGSSKGITEIEIGFGASRQKTDGTRPKAGFHGDAAICGSSLVEGTDR